MEQTPSLVALATRHASRWPERTAFTILSSTGKPDVSVTFSELDRRARRLASRIESTVDPSGTVLLALRFSLDYVVAFLGCLYAKRIAVPALAPQFNRYDSRLSAIAADCGAKVALTNSGQTLRPRGTRSLSASLSTLEWIALDEVSMDPGESFGMPDPGSVAFLQYTSGSTATPKGVKITHANLAANERMLQETFEVTSDSVIIGWLPMHHDMGLIGNVLQAIWSGCHSVILPSTAFLQRPAIWLEAITKYRGTISGGPNFAYDLCVDRIQPDVISELDLSCWKIAFNGSECVRAETLDRFSAAFSRSGFRSSVWRPCYGLAEATLLVSAASEIRCARMAVENGSAERLLVSNGTPASGVRIEILDPERGSPLPAGDVGEICVAGPAVSTGYWRDTPADEPLFRVLLDESAPFLRTGDLGFIENGELFISGRRKDVIIVRGRNHYAQDVEHTASRSHPGVQGYACALVAHETGNVEQVILLQEIQRGSTDELRRDAARALRKAVAAEHGIALDQIIFVLPHSLAKTTSGKLQRAMCRDLYLRGELRAVGADERRLDGYESDFAYAGEGVGDDVDSAVHDLAARILRLPASAIDPKVDLTAYGMDSLGAAELRCGVETRFGVQLADDWLMGSASISEIAAAVAGAQRREEPARLPAPTEYSLTAGQKALWFLQQLEPAGAAYNVSIAARVRGLLKEGVLRRAFEKLIERHSTLRTVFVQSDGGPLQRIRDNAGAFYSCIDVSLWTEEEIRNRIDVEIETPFCLDAGPVFRVVVLRRSSEDAYLLLIAHHIIIDFRSLQILLQEASELYQGNELAEEPTRFADFVSEQQELLACDRGVALLDYWRRHLDGAPPSFGWRVARRNASDRPSAGAAVSLDMGQERSAKVAALARERRVSVNCVLLAAFKTLLYRYTGQRDVLVGTPALGRTRSEWMNTAGYFINPVLIRSRVAGDVPFSTLLNSVKATLRDALIHQQYPYSLLVENLRSAGGGAAPAIEAMFIHLGGSGDLAGLGEFALGQAGAVLPFGDLKLESIEVRRQHGQFDLTMTVAQAGDGLRVELRYRREVFDAALVERMLAQYLQLLDSVVCDCDAPVAELSIQTPAESASLVESFQRTAAVFDDQDGIGRQFARAVSEHAEATAVAGSGQEVTYRDLGQMSSRITAYLASRGVGPGALVALRISRRPELASALMGVLQSGAAYLPIDPSFPAGRAQAIVDAARPELLLSDGGEPLLNVEAAPVSDALAYERFFTDVRPVEPDSAAYVMFTSGSTGTPKGVVVTHRNLLNLFRAMDLAVGCTSADTVFASTSISFDISVLELVWPLCRGSRIVLLSEQTISGAPRRTSRPATGLSFSLSYFADASAGQGSYRLLLDGARYADEHGFEAVWTPERHFHPFGGLYPNPAVTGAALAAITRRVGIRAGSVVMPLHDPVRVAEEWAAVDGLSGGRVAIAFASGWHADDFALAPQNYADRKRIMVEGIRSVRELWRGGTVRRANGTGDPIEIRSFPRPVQPELPFWITAAGNDETFITAGTLGGNVLTHLLGQEFSELERKIRAYRSALAQSGFDPSSRRVTLMLHAFVGDTVAEVRQLVERPFTEYLRSSAALMARLAQSLRVEVNLDLMPKKDVDDLLRFAFDRYFDSSALFGTPSSLKPLLARAMECGVNEVACLIDFGVEHDRALVGLDGIARLRESAMRASVPSATSFVEVAKLHAPTLLQCTPSMLRIMTAEPGALSIVGRLRALLVGGEVFPPDLAETLHSECGSPVFNMYGPTETTVWSCCARLTAANPVSIGSAVANTQVYLLDADMNLTPRGVPGEIFIGGDGVAAGYLKQPDLSAGAFVPDPFSARPGARMYRTGDYGRWQEDGSLEFLGRKDQQVKIRGVRIELGEIESALLTHSGIRECAVTVNGSNPAQQTVVAYYTCERDFGSTELREHLKPILHPNALPSLFVRLEKLPLTHNGKINRKQLVLSARPEPVEVSAAPSNEYERILTGIWQRVLNANRVGLDDNFFDLGGHSLLLVQVQSEIRDAFGHEAPILQLLEHSTIRSLAESLAAGEQLVEAAAAAHAPGPRDKAGVDPSRVARQIEYTRRLRQKHEGPTQ